MAQQVHPHRFGRPRPSLEQLRLTQRPTQPGRPFQPLPPPTGASPFHMDLATIVTPATLASIKSGRTLVIHTVGDTGGIKDAMPQQIVADSMEHQFDHGKPPGLNPALLYLLGDCVYFNGEVDQYFPRSTIPTSSMPLPSSLSPAIMMVTRNSPNHHSRPLFTTSARGHRR